MIEPGALAVTVVEHIDPENLVPSGIDTVVVDMVRYRPDVRFRIVGVTASESRVVGTWSTATIDGVEVDFLPVARLNRLADTSRAPHSLRFIAGLAKFRQEVKRHPNRVVHAHRLETGYAARLLGLGRPVQFIHNATANLLSEKSDSFWRKIPAVYRQIERSHLPSCPSIVVFNGAEHHRMSRLNDRALRGFTWFDPKIYYPPERANKTGLAMVWVGRLESQKDPILAIEVLASLRAGGHAATLTVVGDGSLKEDIARLARTLGVEEHLNIAGALPRKSVADAMRSSDLLLMTSRYEGSPTVAVEALACGLAIACTPESDPDGLLLDARVGSSATDRRPDSIAKAVLAAAATPPEARPGRVADRAGPAMAAALLQRTLEE